MGGKRTAARVGHGGIGRVDGGSGDGHAEAGRVFGYARVSTRDQNLARQLDALREFGVVEANVFADKASGKDFDRPEWARLMGELHEGDVLVVKSIDRLGRNYDDILEQWRVITKERGAAVVVLDIPLLDTRMKQHGITATFVADLVLQLLSYVAQMEREHIHQRQAEGIAAARARGVHLGRPPKLRPATYRQVRAAYLAGRITRAEAAARLEIGVSTFDKWIREDASETPIRSA